MSLARIAVLTSVVLAAGLAWAEDAPKERKPMKMNEPMAGEMKKDSSKKGDVKKAAEKKERDMKPVMESEEKAMKPAK